MFTAGLRAGLGDMATGLAEKHPVDIHVQDHISTQDVWADRYGDGAEGGES